MLSRGDLGASMLDVDEIEKIERQFTREGLEQGQDRAAAKSAIKDAIVADTYWCRLIDFFSRLASEEVLLEILDGLVHTAAECGRVEALEKLLKSLGTRHMTAAPSYRNSLGETPLHKSAEYGNVNCLIKLLESLEREDPEIKVSRSTIVKTHEEREKANKEPFLDKYGNSPLHSAVKEGSLDCVKELLQHFPDLLLHSNLDGDTAFHVAARWDRSKYCLVMDFLRSKVSKTNRGQHKALSRRNSEGHTPSYIAARYNNQGVLQYMMDHDSGWKEGLLGHKEFRIALFIFIILSGFLLAILIPILLAENSFNEETRRETAEWCDPTKTDTSFHMTIHTSFSNEEYWRCRCAPFDYYGNYVLSPNAFIICSVFFFKLLEFFCTKQLFPLIDFVWHFFISLLSNRKSSTELTDLEKIKNVLELEKARKTRKEISNRASLYQLQKAKDSNELQKLVSELSTECIEELLGEAKNSSDLENGRCCCCILKNENNTSFTNLYKCCCQPCDPALDILQEWRKKNYKSIPYSSPAYHDYHFSFQVEYLFLYAQVASSIYSIAWVVWGLSKSTDVWKRERTSSSVSDWFLKYNNFYGMLVNSDCTNTVFSLFQMAFMEERYSQLTQGWKNLPWGWCVAWLVFVYLPVFILIPPFLTHILPGVFEFFWLFLPIWFVFYLMQRISCIMKMSDEDFNTKAPDGPKTLLLSCFCGKDKRKNSCARNITSRLDAILWQLDLFLWKLDLFLKYSAGKCINSFIDRLIACIDFLSDTKWCGVKTWCNKTPNAPNQNGTSHENDDLKKVKQELRRIRLQHYFYDFFLEIFARFAFIFIFQLTFDFATLSYLGHNGPEFSELYIRSGGRQGGQESGYGRYIMSVSRVFKWRSQTYCFLQEGLRDLHWVEVLGFL